MKESVGYTVSLNIMIIFITIIVAFLCAALIYFKSNKVSNIITSGIEKYEGYNNTSINEISMNLTSIGYGSHSLETSCREENPVEDKGTFSGTCNLLGDEFVNAQGQIGYCVYICYEEDNFEDGIYKGEYYYYKIRTNMMINVPILNNFLDIPIYSNTNRLYNFDHSVNN